MKSSYSPTNRRSVRPQTISYSFSYMPVKSQFPDTPFPVKRVAAPRAIGKSFSSSSSSSSNTWRSGHAKTGINREIYEIREKRSTGQDEQDLQDGSTHESIKPCVHGGRAQALLGSGQFGHPDNPVHPVKRIFVFFAIYAVKDQPRSLRRCTRRGQRSAPSLPHLCNCPDICRCLC